MKNICDRCIIIIKCRTGKKLMIKLFDKLYFIGPMSLGDSFVMSGMAHYYADRCHELHLPVPPYFFKTLDSLYHDHPHIKVVEISEPILGENGNEATYIRENGLSKLLRIELLRSVIRNFDLIPMWDLQLYSSYELSYGLRYSNFRLPKYVEGSKELYQDLSQGEPYVLVHRYTGNHPEGIPINIQEFRKIANLPDIKIIEITDNITDNMMQYVDLIKNAEEIHVVPSSFHCLVDSMETNASLYFHDIREKTSMAINSDWNNHRWTIVKYQNRL